MRVKVIKTIPNHWAEIDDEVTVINNVIDANLYTVEADKDVTIGGVRVIRKSWTEELCLQK